MPRTTPRNIIKAMLVVLYRRLGECTKYIPSHIHIIREPGVPGSVLEIDHHFHFRKHAIKIPKVQLMIWLYI